MFERAARREGFTLIELAIVLVIIGLLVGGILVAQSMINAANITATVKQIGQFDAGVENFKTKYGYLPGDAPAFGGDGDGMIARTIAAAGSPLSINCFQCEIANFWNNLFPDQYQGATCPTMGYPEAGLNVPAAKLGTNGTYFIAMAIGSGAYYADTTNPQNYYGILSVGNFGVRSNPGTWVFQDPGDGKRAIKPADLLALDTKMDDGLANSGNVQSGLMPGGNAGLNFGGPATCSSSSTYEIQNTGYECTPLIRIGGQTGDPQ